MQQSTHTNSQHLAEARRLLDELEGETDPQAMASAATAHAILVLAEQVAVARIVIAPESAPQLQRQPQAAETN
jgi:hypothetical protein